MCNKLDLCHHFNEKQKKLHAYSINKKLRYKNLIFQKYFIAE